MILGPGTSTGGFGAGGGFGIGTKASGAPAWRGSRSVVPDVLANDDALSTSSSNVKSIANVDQEYDGE